MKTKIEWATHTWNPVTGCTPISEGCEHCYAARMAKRLAGRCGYPKDDPFRPGTFHADKLNDPLKIKTPSMIFVCSMGDLFHESVDVDVIFKIFEVIDKASHHTYLLLTKRPETMRSFFEITGEWDQSLWPNLWLGVTAENQARADERIPILLSIPAAVRFVSVEPMLGPVDLNRAGAIWADMNGSIRPEYQQPCRTIDWVICGGETGPGARPMHPDWARSLRDQCKSASVPFFFKSMGDWWRNTHGYARCDKIQSRYLDGVEYGEYPEGVE